MLSIATANRRRPSRISLRFDLWTSIAVSRKTPSASAIRPISSLRLRPGTSIDVSPAARPLIAAVMFSMGLTTRGTTYSTAITIAPTTLRVVMRRSKSWPLPDGLGGADRRGIAAVLGSQDEFRHLLAETQDERVVGLQGRLSNRDLA